MLDSSSSRLANPAGLVLDFLECKHLSADSALGRAVIRGAVALESQLWYYGDGTLRMLSTDCVTWYVIRHKKCTCPAGAKNIICKHRAAAAMLQYSLDEAAEAVRKHNISTITAKQNEKA